VRSQVFVAVASQLSRFLAGRKWLLRSVLAIVASGGFVWVSDRKSSPTAA
jgi:hypothetical protein